MENFILQEDARLEELGKDEDLSSMWLDLRKQGQAALFQARRKEDVYLG